MPSPFDLPPLLLPTDRPDTPPVTGAPDTPVMTAAPQALRGRIATVARTPVDAVALEVAARLIRPYAAGALACDDARELERMCARYGIRLEFDPAEPVTAHTPVGVRHDVAEGGKGGSA